MGWMAVSRPIRSPFPVHQAFWIMLFHLFNCPCRIGGICQNKLCLASADFLYVSIGNPSGPGDLLFGALLRAFSSSSIVMGLTSDQFSLSQIYLLLNDALKLSRMFCYAAGSVSSFEYRFWQNLWAIQSIWSVVYQEAPFESFNDWMSVLTNFGFIISKLNFDDTSPNYWYLALNLSWFFLESCTTKVLSLSSMAFPFTTRFDFQISKIFEFTNSATPLALSSTPLERA
ncbi:hypothetical protein MP228_000500 [Amoeboaphelidium protococcarum]|nr:hypothetical protein MP228_000500 [Amoeboaphelidium protococcarum]